MIELECCRRRTQRERKALSLFIFSRSAFALEFFIHNFINWLLCLTCHRNLRGLLSRGDKNRDEQFEFFSSLQSSTNVENEVKLFFDHFIEMPFFILLRMKIDLECDLNLLFSLVLRQSPCKRRKKVGSIVEVCGGAKNVQHFIDAACRLSGVEPFRKMILHHCVPSLASLLSILYVRTSTRNRFSIRGLPTEIKCQWDFF